MMANLRAGKILSARLDVLHKNLNREIDSGHRRYDKMREALEEYIEILTSMDRMNGYEPNGFKEGG